jgi:ABC-type antimicrobial peptide transport system permease subunit
MTPKEKLALLFKKIWRCGVIVSIVSVLLSIASTLYFNRLIGASFGMHGFHDKRMSTQEICGWWHYVIHVTSETFLVGAIFAVVGGVACLAYKFSRKHAAP